MWSGNVADLQKGFVDCPEGGPTVMIPDPRWVRVEHDTIYIEAQSLRCYHQVGRNPPHLEPIDVCPPELLPTLINGATVTEQKDGACFWNDVRVRCP